MVAGYNRVRVLIPIGVSVPGTSQFKAQLILLAGTFEFESLWKSETPRRIPSSPLRSPSTRLFVCPSVLHRCRLVPSPSSRTGELQRLSHHGINRGCRQGPGEFRGSRRRRGNVLQVREERPLGSGLHSASGGVGQRQEPRPGQTRGSKPGSFSKPRQRGGSAVSTHGCLPVPPPFFLSPLSFPMNSSCF